MRQFALIVWFVLSFLSCSQEKEMVISDDRFEQILFDLYQADAISQINYTSLGVQDTKKELLLKILDRNDVTFQQYDSTVLWYSQNSDRYFKVYDKILKRIDRLERSNNKEIEKIVLLALSPKGDSVLLNKDLKMVRLDRFRENYSLSITKDKHFEKKELFRLNFSVPVLVRDTLFAKLSSRLQSGEMVDRSDTIVRSGVHAVTLTVDQELSSVTMQFRIKKSGYDNAPIWISDIQFIRVHIDSTRLEKH